MVPKRTARRSRNECKQSTPRDSVAIQNSVAGVEYRLSSACPTPIPARPAVVNAAHNIANAPRPSQGVQTWRLVKAVAPVKSAGLITAKAIVPNTPRVADHTGPAQFPIGAPRNAKKYVGHVQTDT